MDERPPIWKNFTPKGTTPALRLEMKGDFVLSVPDAPAIHFKPDQTIILEQQITEHGIHITIKNAASPLEG